jgi:hypothetical protein
MSRLSLFDQKSDRKGYFSGLKTAQTQCSCGAECRFYEHCPEILGELYFRFGIRIIPENRYPLDPGGIKRICIFGTSGIGNLIMLTLMIRTLKAGIPDSKINVFVLPNGAKDVLEGSPFVDQVIVLDGKSKIGEIRHDFPDLAISATHKGFMRAKEAFRTGAFWRIGSV